jgi:pre-mRNA-splicing factor SYF1
LQNFSGFEETKEAYEATLQMRIATPEIVLNFARFLQENGYQEESFRVYEKSVQIFNWPHCYEVWVTYLTKIIEKIAGSKVERIRHLF